MVTFTYYLGVVGAMFLLFSLVVGQAGKTRNTDLVCDVLNAVGSLCLAIFSAEGVLWHLVVLNGVWTMSAVYDIYAHLTGQHHKKFHILKAHKYVAHKV